MPRTNALIYQLHVSLQGIVPMIWRRIEVPDHTSLPQFHRTLQIVMGWENYHLHQFRAGGKCYAAPDPEDNHFGQEVLDERRRKLSALLPFGDSFEYLYDFGDDWLHTITLEEVSEPRPRKRYPVCLDGARSAPPEDVGGPFAYQHYLEALFDPKHPEHQFLLEWHGRFQSEDFSVARVNRQLAEAFPVRRASARRRPTSSSTATPAPMTFEQEFDVIVHSITHAGRLPKLRPRRD